VVEAIGAAVGEPRKPPCAVISPDLDFRHTKPDISWVEPIRAGALMNIKAIFGLFSVLMVAVLMIFVIVNIWLPDLIEPGVFKKTLYTFGVLVAGSVVVSALVFLSRGTPREDTN
jgi:hypothetical protein